MPCTARKQSPGWRAAVVALAVAMLLSLPALAAEQAPAAALPEPVALALLRLARAGPDDRVLALVAGDGNSVTAAAARLGVKAASASPDTFNADLSQVTILVLRLPAEAAARLRPVLLMLRPGTRIVSLDTGLGDWKPDRTVAVDVPQAAKGRANLWTVPARLTGEWCGQDEASGARVRLDQRFQVVQGEFRKAASSLRFDGRIEGTRVTAAAGQLALEQSGDILRITLAQGRFAAYRNASFARTCCGTCP